MPLRYNEKRMNPTLKRYLLSSLTTLVATFLSLLAMQINNGGIQWTVTFWVTAAMVALRGAVKALTEGLVGQHADLPA